MGTSALYLGEVMHRRLGGVRHRFAYRVFSLLLNLDELDSLASRLRLFSHNGPNLFSFMDRDHGPRDGSPLRPWVEAQLARTGIDLEGGAIELLCFPRVLGYAFNPISVYFCRHASGSLAAVLYDVRNTFGEKHGYLFPVGGGRDQALPIRHVCLKRFYVSPFIPMRASYGFRLNPPSDTYRLAILERSEDHPILVATHTAHRRSLSDPALAAAFLSHPLMTLKVIAAIHWEALRLWLKGARLQDRPKAPDLAVSIIDARQTAGIAAD